MSFSIRSHSFCLLLLLMTVTAVTADYPDVIELVGYNSRHARTHMKPPQTPQSTDSKMQADIETVKQNIDKYNKLLTLDTHGLPDSQKDMLERIVERVARLKESLDINESYSSGVASSTTETYSTDNLSTIDQELTTSEDLAVTEREEEDFNTLRTEVPTDADFQMIAGRANNNAAITALESTNTTPLVGNSSASQRTLTTIGKVTKTRATKRPNVNHNNNNSPSPSSSSSAMPASNGYTSGGQNANTPPKRIQKPVKQKISTTNSYTTIHPHAQQYQQQQKLQIQLQQQQQQPVQSPSMHKTTLSTTAQQMATDDRLTSSAMTPQTVVDVLKQNLDANSSNMSLLYSTKQQQQQLQQQQLQQPSANGYSGGLTLNGNNNNYNNLNFPSSGNYNNNNINNNNDLVYDTKVNATAIINSLNNAREEYYQQQQQQLQLQHQQQQQQLKESGIINKDKLPTATAKPTKYHYYPHNQHIYLLPECAIQQVCNAVYVRLNYTQPLCACPSRYRDPCSASLNEDDQHTTKLIGDGKKKAITLAKTCESTTEMRECRSPKDWSLLALQNTRTGKSHYLVICRCPEYFKMEGPMSHDQPTYASVPGIRVFGMMCVKPGYSVRKPPSQPPKRYQMQNNHYRPGNLGDSLQNSYVSGNLGTSLYLQDSNKDAYGRPHTPTISVNNNGAGYHDTHDVYHQSSHQVNSQYLNRPESDSALNDVNRLRPDLSVGNQLPDSIYGRTNEREGETPIESTKDDEELKNTSSASTLTVSEPNIVAEERKDEESALPAEQTEAIGRTKREILEEVDDTYADDMPEFPWNRVIEFQQSIVWD